MSASEYYRDQGSDIYIPGASEPTLKNASAVIEKGDFLAIVGNNGCGKSTLCKTLNGLIPHFIVGDMDGEVLIDGMNTKEQEIGTLARKVGYVYQDFENQIVCPTVLEDASYACLNYAMPDYEEKGKKALKVCGLSSKVDDYVWQLSGGQKHLLALAGNRGVKSGHPDPGRTHRPAGSGPCRRDLRSAERTE